ncbi:hypothetical protein ACFYO9_29220 [Streptomyces sp. NPDC005863]|uniref:hypothetical protein n=1 Tax=unclassified Streptomyces TaxID=2593676 RepID=UPI0033D8C01F
MIDPVRLRETMAKLLCQVCGKPAAMPDGRLLFLHSTEECGHEPSAAIRTA